MKDSAIRFLFLFFFLDRFKLFIQKFLASRPEIDIPLSIQLSDERTSRDVNFSRNAERTNELALLSSLPSSLRLGSISSLLQSSPSLEKDRVPRSTVFHLLLLSVFFFLLTRIHKFLPPYGKEIRVSTRGAVDDPLKNPEQLSHEYHDCHGWLTKGIFSIIPRGVSSRWNSPRLTRASRFKRIKEAFHPTSKHVCRCSFSISRRSNQPSVLEFVVKVLIFANAWNARHDVRC